MGLHARQGLDPPGRGAGRHLAMRAPHTGLPCPHSPCFAPMQLDSQQPSLAGPQTTAHGGQGAQPLIENSIWGGLPWGAGRGEGTRVHACGTTSSLARVLSGTISSPAPDLQELVQPNKGACFHPGFFEVLRRTGCAGEREGNSQPRLLSRALPLNLGHGASLPSGQAAAPARCLSPSLFV